MSNHALRMLYKTGIQTTPQKMTEVLEKIRLLSAVKASRFNLRKNLDWFKGQELTSFTIDETLATGTIVLNAGPRFGVSAASAIIQDLTYAAKAVAGWYANDVTIQYLDPSPVDTVLAVSVADHAIKVQLDGDPATAAVGTLNLTTDIVLTSVAKGTARNTTTLTTQVLAAAANPTDMVLVAFSGTAAAIVCTVTPNDGTNNGATPVDLTTAELVELINTGAVVGKNITLTDGSSLRALQTATGGDATALADAGEGDGTVATFAGALDYHLVSTAAQIKAAIEANAAANALVGITVSGVGTNVQAVQAATPLAGGSNVQTYDKADIYLIKRIRTKKYVIVLNGSANPAA